MGRIDLKLQIKYDRQLWQSKLQLIQQQQQQKEQNQEQNGQSSNSDSNIQTQEQEHNEQSSKSDSNIQTQEQEQQEQQPVVVVMMMNLQIYRDTIEGKQGKFMDTLMTVSTDKGLSATAILNQVTPLGNTVLHLAAKFGHHHLAGHLACNFPHLILTTNRRGDTPFILAARSGHKLTAYIISRFAEDSPNCCSGLVRPHPWKSAPPQPQPDLMLRMTNKDGNTALHEALIAKHHEMVDCLLPIDLEITFSYANTLGKTPFYIAIETGQINIVKKILQFLPVPTSEIFKIAAGNSPINAAIKTMNTDILVMVCEKIPSLVYTRDEDGGTPLHCAASVGYYKGVEFLLNRYTELILEHDNRGFLPIHIASQKGHLEIMKKLLREYPDSMELNSTRGENILHIASKFGRIGIVKYILETPNLKVLINQKDDDGNTPLHLATRNWFPKIVSCLTWEKGVDLNLINDDGMTALDIAEEFGGVSPSFRKRLTWITLKAAGGEPSKYPKTLHNKLNQPNNQIMESPSNRVDYKDRVNTLLLVSTLVATVTFAAGFTVPGGYNNSAPDQGQATMLNKRAFQTFVICDTIAMYSAIIVAVTLIWAQLGDLHLVLSSLTLAMPLLGLSLTTMSTAFLAGVWLVVSKVGWLSQLILITGIVFLSFLLMLFIPLFFPNSSKNIVMRYLSYYLFFKLMLITSGSNDHEQQDLAA